MPVSYTVKPDKYQQILKDHTPPWMITKFWQDPVSLDYKLEGLVRAYLHIKHTPKSSYERVTFGNILLLSQPPTKEILKYSIEKMAAQFDKQLKAGLYDAWQYDKDGEIRGTKKRYFNNYKLDTPKH